MDSFIIISGNALFEPELRVMPFLSLSWILVVDVDASIDIELTMVGLDSDLFCLGVCTYPSSTHSSSRARLRVSWSPVKQMTSSSFIICSAMFLFSSSLSSLLLSIRVEGFSLLLSSSRSVKLSLFSLIPLISSNSPSPFNKKESIISLCIIFFTLLTSPLTNIFFLCLAIGGYCFVSPFPAGLSGRIKHCTSSDCWIAWDHFPGMSFAPPNLIDVTLRPPLWAMA